MSALTNFAETTLINAALRNVAFTPPTAWFVALHTADPTEVGNVAEVSGGGYARKAVTFTAPTDGVTPNGNLLTWTAAGGNFGGVGFVSIWDNVSAGNPWFKGPLLTGARVVNDGDTIEFAVGTLLASLA